MVRNVLIGILFSEFAFGYSTQGFFDQNSLIAYNANSSYGFFESLVTAIAHILCFFFVTLASYQFREMNFYKSILSLAASIFIASASGIAEKFTQYLNI